MTPAQYDQKLLESASSLSKTDLGPYFGSGRPISSHANSGNAWAQVIVDAGGTVPQVPNVYYGSGIAGKNTPYFPLGSGNPLGTPSYAQQAITAVKNTISSIQSTVTSSVSSAFNSVKSKIWK